MQTLDLLYKGFIFLHFDVVDPRTPWIPKGKMDCFYSSLRRSRNLEEDSDRVVVGAGDNWIWSQTHTVNSSAGCGTPLPSSPRVPWLYSMQDTKEVEHTALCFL